MSPRGALAWAAATEGTGAAERWAREELSGLARNGLLRELEPLQSPQGPEVVIAGRTLVNFSSNDYLGLAAEPALAQAAQRALERHGVGSGASRLVVGDTLAHRSLERALAEFEGAEAALLFNSGYAANLGAVAGLCGKQDVVFSDALNHASLVDGCRLSRAQVVIYPHADARALEQLLRAHPGRRQLVVTDAVFSMDGDLAPLPELVAACQRHGAALLVDEAHATGVLGPRGAGLCAALGLTREVDLRMGTLSKALGCYGAYVAGPAAVLQLLVQRARPLVFSTSLPPALCAAAEAALQLCAQEPARRERLARHIQTFARGLRALGFPAQGTSAIFPVVLGSPEAALDASRALRERGLLVKAIRPPTVPPGTSRLRFALSAAHTDEHLALALEALAALEVGR